MDPAGMKPLSQRLTYKDIAETVGRIDNASIAAIPITPARLVVGWLVQMSAPGTEQRSGRAPLDRHSGPARGAGPL